MALGLSCDDDLEADGCEFSLLEASAALGVVASRFFCAVAGRGCTWLPFLYNMPIEKDRHWAIVCHCFAEAVFFAEKYGRHCFCEAVAHAAGTKHKGYPP